MSLPPPYHPVWERLAGGSLARIRTENLGIQLMAKRLERTPEAMPRKAAEIHGFFSKWERVLQAEIRQLQVL